MKPELWDREGSHYGNRIIVEDRGDVFGRKLVRGITDKEACLANGTVANNDASEYGHSSQLFVQSRNVVVEVLRGRQARYTYLMVATTMVD